MLDRKTVEYAVHPDLIPGVGLRVNAQLVFRRM
jgi:hypothetical protein